MGFYLNFSHFELIDFWCSAVHLFPQLTDEEVGGGRKDFEIEIEI